MLINDTIHTQILYIIIHRVQIYLYVDIRIHVYMYTSNC
jgi:hypothetical protein